MTVREARKHLAEKANSLSDQEVESLINKLRPLASALVDATLIKMGTMGEDEERNNTTSSIVL